MNLSRAYTLAYGDELSVGRVQTPDARHGGGARTRRSALSCPEDYLEVIATFRPTGRADAEAYKGTWFRDVEEIQKSARLPPMARKRKQIVARAQTGAAAIESVKAETQRMGPPPLYDLTELQRHANRLFGFSAQKTLDVAQALYERHKLLSYPRTDSRHLSQDVAATLPRIVQTDRGPYREHARAGHRREARWAAASWTTRRSATTTPSSPPLPRRTARTSRRTNGRSTTWSAAAC